MVDWDKDHADIKWTKPEYDGGSPLTGYVIEYRVFQLDLIINIVYYSLMNLLLLYYFFFIVLP